MAHRDSRRHGRRYRQIAEILARHGLGYFIGVLGLERFVPFERGWLGHPRREARYTRPEHLRMAIEELGATFIKLGQIMSTRADLLPPEFMAELAKLQDSAPPFASEAARALLTDTFDRPVEDLFATFDWTPLAAGSIGQAHAATLENGAEVVVKIRRPGVVEQVEEDLEIVQQLALTASRRWRAARDYDLARLAGGFAETLRGELDYVREGQSAERIAANFAGDAHIHIPRVYWDVSAAHVLTAERIRGIKINDLAALDAAGIDRVALARRAADAILKMVFEDGFFHADPHPGNFFIEPDGRIGLIDFGMVGTLDDRTRDRMLALLIAMTADDDDQLVDAFLGLGAARGRVDRSLLRQDLRQLVDRYVARSLAEVEIGALLNDALSVARRHHLQLPPDLALVLKMAVMVEGLGAQLDPAFHLMSAMQPYGQRMLLRRFSPGVWARQFAHAGIDAAELGVELPRRTRRILHQIERGELEFGVRPTDMEPVLRRLELLVNRIVLSVIVAAFIIGLAALMTIYHPPGWERWAGVVFTVGFVVASILGAYVLWSVVRGDRR